MNINALLLIDAVVVCSLIHWLPSYDRGGAGGGGAEYQAAAGGNVTVYVDSGKALDVPTLGGAGYSRVSCLWSVCLTFTMLRLHYIIWLHSQGDHSAGKRGKVSETQSGQGSFKKSGKTGKKRLMKVSEIVVIIGLIAWYD